MAFYSLEPIWFTPPRTKTHTALYKDSPSPPPQPDYVGAANATAAGNIDAARAAASANKVNQVTPYGNLTYTKNGTDSYGNDMWTATQSLSPAQQGILDSTNTLNKGLMNTANNGLSYANDVLSHPGVDASTLPQVGMNPGQSYQDAMMARMQPQIEQDREALTAQLANQGIAQGTQAWDNAWRQQNQKENDLRNSATINGFNTGLSANQNAFQQQSYNQMQPINVINALRTGSQVQNPNFVSVPQQATTSGPDILGATNAQYQNQMSGYNAKQAANSNMMGGLFGLGGAALMAPNGTFAFSDIRLKSKIRRIGRHKTGVGIYSYIKFGKHEIGVIAQEVEKIIPEAVSTNPSGYLMVDYGRLA